MNTFSKKQDSREFENESHIVRKKKAEAKKQTVKNFRDRTQFVEHVDEDEEYDIEEYARYIK